MFVQVGLRAVLGLIEGCYFPAASFDGFFARGRNPVAPGLIEERDSREQIRGSECFTKLAQLYGFSRSKQHTSHDTVTESVSISHAFPHSITYNAYHEVLLGPCYFATGLHLATANRLPDLQNDSRRAGRSREVEPQSHGPVP